MSEYRLIQVSDLHLGAGQAHHYDNWQLVAAWIEREKPEVVVVNGDLVMENPDIEADHAFAREAIGQLTVPTRYLPGNHDIGDNVLFGKMAQRVNDERRARFVRHFGEERWVFEGGGWAFVGINAQLFGSGGQPAEDEQWAWIEQSFAQLAGHPIALFLHKPLFLDHPREADYEDLTLRQSVLDLASRTRLLELCQRFGVRLVSCGHKHQSRSFSLNGIYHVWSPATACVNGRPDALHWGVREVGFVEYRFQRKRFTHRFIGADFLFRHENYMRKATQN